VTALPHTDESKIAPGAVAFTHTLFPAGRHRTTQHCCPFWLIQQLSNKRGAAMQTARRVFARTALCGRLWFGALSLGSSFPSWAADPLTCGRTPSHKDPYFRKPAMTNLGRLVTKSALCPLICPLVYQIPNLYGFSPSLVCRVRWKIACPHRLATRDSPQTPATELTICHGGH
jgi:hypothetical protein